MSALLLGIDHVYTLIDFGSRGIDIRFKKYAYSRSAMRPSRIRLKNIRTFLFCVKDETRKMVRAQRAEFFREKNISFVD